MCKDGWLRAACGLRPDYSLVSSLGKVMKPLVGSITQPNGESNVQLVTISNS